MRRTCGYRHQAARELVHALRTALEQGDPPLDAKFDRLVITRFEMEAGNVDFCSPVAAPERRGAEDIQSGADGLAPAFSEDQQNIVGERLAEPHKKIQGQIRRRMVLAVRLGITMKKEGPVRRLDLASDQPAKRYPGSRELVALLADVFALGVIHGRQKIVEIPESGIGPVELHALAHQQPRTLALRRFLSFRKENVQ